MIGVPKIFSKRMLWSFAIYVEPRLDGANLTPSGRPVALFDSSRSTLVHTQADPFVFAYGDDLFIFYEKVERGGYGTIAAKKTSDFKHFKDFGVILKENYHLSYPFIFKDEDSFFLLPESGKSGETWLYQFGKFPISPEKLRRLLVGDYADPWIIKRDNIYYLFATSADGLELFYSDNLRTGEFVKHPQSPVTTDSRFSRSGGGPLLVEGRLYRVAQDCSCTYGENVNLLEILELNRYRYRDIVTSRDVLDRLDKWNSDGTHHISTTFYKDKKVFVVDGRHPLRWYRRLLLKFMGLLSIPVRTRT